MPLKSSTGSTRPESRQTTTVAARGIKSHGRRAMADSNIFGLTFVYLTIVFFVNLTCVVDAKDYCLAETFNASCQADEVIMMTSATYGRMQAGSCIKSEYGHMGCQADVTSFMDDECSGRQHCVFPVTRLLGVATPCPSDITSYLDASFACVKVATASARCSSEGYTSLTDTQDGFIPLSSSPQTPSGGTSSTSRRCRWKVTVDPYQRLQFSVLAFGVRQPQTTGREAPHETVGGGEAGGGVNHCPWSIMFEEGPNDVDLSLCRLNGRQVSLYTSTTNTVTAYLLHKQNLALPGTYILKYEAIGCPQVKVTDNVWVQQDGTTAKVKCNSTEETWFLACSGRQWAGELGNCTANTANAAGAAIRDNVSNASVTGVLPYGFIVAVIIGVVLGVVIGAIPLGLVYLCLKRKWKRQPPIYMHEGGFYPDIQHVIQSEEDMLRSSNTYPALLKSSGVKSSDSPAGIHCCSRGQPYTDIYPVSSPGGFGSVGSDPTESVCWENRRTVTTPRIGAGCYRLAAATDCPMTTTAVMGPDGTLLRCNGRHHDHVYESASFARNNCLQHCMDVDPTQGAMDDGRAPQGPLGHQSPPIVYYEVDASAVAEKARTGRGVDVLPNCRSQQSAI